jgi:hypothetical protein
MMKFVEKLVSVRPYQLTLEFDTGGVRVVDLEATLRAKAISPPPTGRGLKLGASPIGYLIHRVAP